MGNIKLDTRIIFLAILILGAILRFYNLNWDNGHQLHPDERAIIMAVDKLKYPNDINEFLTPESAWNPKFFAYGSFPMYTLKVTGSVLNAINPPLNQYTSLTLIGRFISAAFDLLTVILIYKIAKKLLNTNAALLSSFFYAVAVLPIQLSHFFAVDTILTCFMMATIYRLLIFYEKPGFKNAAFVGFFWGLALATKISAIVLVVSIGITLIVDFLLVFLKTPTKIGVWQNHLPKYTIHLLKYFLLICIFTLITFLFFEPYAWIDFSTFWHQTIQQSALTNDPFAFPYTLQFVNKIPYYYEIKNIFLFGLGPAIASLAFAGTVYFIFALFKKTKTEQFAKELIVYIFFFAYFLVVGKFAVGFMRYMLPLYPLLCLFAAFLAYQITTNIKPRNFRSAVSYLLFAICLIWPLSYVSIYTRPNTRISASNWIYSNIDQSKILAVEHWDDQLPIGQSSNYRFEVLKLYDPESSAKWTEINSQLDQAHYIILASNRLYTPLQKLSDCTNLPDYKCYPQTASYYKKLFSGELGFQKVAEFASHPTIPIFNIPINDQLADENFTVFDHPKIMIFKKI